MYYVCDFIFVSSHKEVRDALFDNCIFFYLVYPDYSRKEEFIQRYKNRGNDDKFIKLVTEKWSEWFNEIKNLPDGCKYINMVFDNLGDEIESLKA